MLASLIFHGVVIFGISFVVFQQPWDYNKEAIVNIKFANAEFDMQGSAMNGLESLQQNSHKLQWSPETLSFKINLNLALDV